MHLDKNVGHFCHFGCNFLPKNWLIPEPALQQPAKNQYRQPGE